MDQEFVKQILDKVTNTIEIVNPDTNITHHREFVDYDMLVQLVILECVYVVLRCLSDRGCDIYLPNLEKQILTHFGIQK